MGKLTEQEHPRIQNVRRMLPVPCSNSRHSLGSYLRPLSRCLPMVPTPRPRARLDQQFCEKPFRGPAPQLLPPTHPHRHHAAPQEILLQGLSAACDLHTAFVTAPQAYTCKHHQNGPHAKRKLATTQAAL